MRLLIGILVFLVWSAGSGYWYACKIKGACHGETANAAAVLTSAEKELISPLDSLPESGSTSVNDDSLLAAANTVDEIPENDLKTSGNDVVTSYDNPDAGNEKPLDSSVLPDQLKTKQTVWFSYAQPIMHDRAEVSDYIREAAAWLRSRPGAKVRLIGYTDDTAARENNLKLGLRRAEAVAELFRKEGLGDAQIDLRSKGEEDPIGDNNSRQGRQQNRRVEMYLIPN